MLVGHRAGGVSLVQVEIRIVVPSLPSSDMLPHCRSSTICNSRARRFILLDNTYN